MLPKVVTQYLPHVGLFLVFAALVLEVAAASGTDSLYGAKLPAEIKLHNAAMVCAVSGLALLNKSTE